MKSHVIVDKTTHKKLCYIEKRNLRFSPSGPSVRWARNVRKD